MNAALLTRLLTAAAVAAAPVAAGPDRLVAIGEGRHINLRCVGAGSPTIVLTAGMGDSSETWRAVEGELAKVSQVCSWDRAGLGSSDPSALPQNVSNSTADLEAVLRAARIAPPYVLVGHSIGSFESLMFAYRHPRQVAAMVLVDPSSPFQNRRFAVVSPAFAAFNSERLRQRTKQLRSCAAELRSGVDRGPDCGQDADRAPVARRIAKFEAVASMTEQFDESSAQLVKATRKLGRVPLIVLTAGKRVAPSEDLASEVPKTFAEWSRMHRELASLSSRGVTRTIPDAGHYIHQERPDALIGAVREALAARTSS